MRVCVIYINTIYITLYIIYINITDQMPSTISKYTAYVSKSTLYLKF